MQKRPAIAAAVLFGLFTASAHAALTLYDGTKPGLPASQGSLAYETLLQTGTQTLSAGSLGPVTLDTTAGGSNSEYAGLSNYGPTSTFVNPAFPVLSAATGFDLTFNMEVNAESHASTDRSGVSVILLGSDSTGIELGFWTNQVWAQGTNANPSLDFNHSEGTISFNPAAGFYSYDLHVQGSTYTLSANGTQILTGPTRNYSAYPLPQGFPDPYTFSNFVFLGDDSSSAQGTFALESIGVAVPEPTSALAVSGAVLLLARRRRHHRSAISGTRTAR